MFTFGPVSLELKISVDRLWAAMKDLKHIIPKMMPLMRASIDVDGDGGAGSLRVIKFPAGVSTNILSVERIDLMDDATYTEVHSLIGGEAKKPYSFYRSTRTFTRIDKNTTIATWSVEYQPLDNFIVPEASKSMFIAMLKAIEAYLLSHDDYTYA